MAGRRTLLHRAVGFVAGAASVRSMRRDVVRPAAVALLLALLVVAAAGSGAVRVASLSAIAFFVAFVLLFTVDRIGRVEVAVETTRAEAVARWRLAPLATPGVPAPPLGGYAMSPQAAAALVEWATRRQPATIVELGPGSSTVLLSRAGRAFLFHPKITCLEHETTFAEHVRGLVRVHGADEVQIVDAPLEMTSVDGWQGRWYAAAALERLPESIDLLVVDGPPERTGPRARYAAYPMLRRRLRPGALVFVDDTSRPAERSMVEQWRTTGELVVVEDGGSFMVLERAESSA